LTKIDKQAKKSYYIIIMTKQNNNITKEKFNKLVKDHMNNLPKNGDIVKGKILSIDNHEIIIDIEGFTTGVIRGPELKNLPEEYQQAKLGDEIEAAVIDLENERGQLELSVKTALSEVAWSFIKRVYKNQEVIEVKINSVNKGGLLASIKGVQAFLPVSQLIPAHYPKVEGGDKKKILKKLKAFVGQKLSVKIISASEEEEKVIISEKKAWEEIQKEQLKKYEIGDQVDGKISAITYFGAFVQFDDGLEGLIRSAEIPKEKPDQKISDIVQVDQEVKPKITAIKGSKVFLSLKKNE